MPRTPYVVVLSRDDFRGTPGAEIFNGGPHRAEESDHTDLAASAEEEAEDVKRSMMITGDGSKMIKTIQKLW